MLFNHPVSEATSNSKITGAYWRAGTTTRLLAPIDCSKSPALYLYFPFQVLLMEEVIAVIQTTAI